MPDGEPNGQVPNAAGQPPNANQGNSDGQVPPTPPTTPPNGGNSDPVHQTPPAGDASGKTPLTLEQALDALDKARKEAARQRVDSKRLAELEEAQRKADLDKLSETERLRKEFADLQLAQTEAQRKAQERVIRAEVRAHAATAGVPPELAGRLIDYAEIEYDDDGEPSNIAKLLDKLVKQYPQLVPVRQPGAPAQPTSVGTTPANPSRSAAQSGAITREYLDSLTARQYAELPDTRRKEILAWMAANPGAVRK